jgi:apolipoprotein N-acyltransferase
MVLHEIRKDPVNKVTRFLKIIGLPALSGTLLVLCFPKPDIEWVAWIALIPLFLAISDERPAVGFLSAFICGLIFFAGLFNWVFEIPGYRLVHHAILIPYMGLYFGFFGLLFCFISQRRGLTSAFLAGPSIWISLEYLRAHLSFLSLPWAFIGHSQYRNTDLIQFSAFTGAYGVSFLIVSVNAGLTAALFSLALSRKDRSESRQNAATGRRTAGYMLLANLVLVALVLYYGHRTVSQAVIGKTLRVAVLQGNIDREKKRHPKKYAAAILKRYTDLTLMASRQEPDLIVWPEAATPGFVLKNMGLYRQVVSLIREVKIYFLIGSSEYPKFMKGRSFNPNESGNTALLFSPEGKVLGQYLKIHLVPFGEEVPFNGIVSWPHFIVPKESKTLEIPGKAFTLFDVKETKFGVVICWEIVFPDLIREFVKRGANFMLNITNEAWFGDTAAPYQLLAVTVFRAVENRISFGRAANTGISCFIDPVGRITGRVQKNHKDTFVEGYLTGDVPLTEKRTFYTRYGDLFVSANVLLSVLLLVLAFSRGKKAGTGLYRKTWISKS